jgi:hypothetical protein
MQSAQDSREWLVRRKSWPVAIPASKVDKALTDLINFIGFEWVTGKVEKYRVWKKNNSLETPDLLFHREPDCNPLIPYFTVALDFLSKGFSQNEAPEKYKALRDLGNIAGSIFYFENYWRSLPNKIGENHIVKTLRSPSSCRGMLAELNTAVHFVQMNVDRVIPQFMDPRNSKDKTDILIYWHNEEIEIHCKSKVPGAGYLVPFDVFDYWAGCFSRDAQFFNRSWYIKLELSGQITISKTKALRPRLNQWLSSRIFFDKTFIDDNVIATSQEIKIPQSGLSKKDIDKLARKPRYRALSAWKGQTDGNYHALSVFDVSTKTVPRLARSLSNSMEEVKKHLIGKRPAIVNIHIFDVWDLNLLVSPQNRGFQYLINNMLKDKNGRKIGALTLSCEEKGQALTGLIGTQTNPALTIENHYALSHIPESLLKQYGKPDVSRPTE